MKGAVKIADYNIHVEKKASRLTSKQLREQHNHDMRDLVKQHALQVAMLNKQLQVAALPLERLA